MYLDTVRITKIIYKYVIELKLSASIENYLSIRYTFNGEKLGRGFTSPLSK